MCIICDLDTEINREGSDYMHSMELAIQHIRKAEKALLSGAKRDKRYDAAHKSLRRLRAMVGKWHHEERVKIVSAQKTETT